MGAKKSKYFSGDTEDQAVLAAANHFGVAPEQVVFDRLEKRHGFVKRRRVVIRVDSTRTAEPAPAPDPVAAVDAMPEAVAELVEAQTEAPADRDPEPPEEASEKETTQRRLQRTLPPEGAEMLETHEEAAALDEGSVESEAGGPSEPEPWSGAEMDEGEADERVLQVATESLRLLLELADIDVSTEIVRTRERLEVEIEGVDDEVFTEQDGQVLLALQHLLPRVMYGELGRIIPCRVDSRGFQSRKESRLRGLARRVALEVARHGGSRTLRPMNPADRRIVHITVADDPDVETESQGSGYFKRVSIRAI